MPKAHIKLACRQLIDATSATPFEQQVFHATWTEFRIQQQSFAKGRNLFTWDAIREAFPKSNPTLPFKVSFAIGGIINALHHQVPGLQDTLEVRNIPFAQHRFELIASDVNDRSAHKVSIIYLTDTLTLYDIIGDQLLLAIDPPHTFLLKMQPGLSICSYVEAQNPRPCEMESSRSSEGALSPTAASRITRWSDAPATAAL